MLNQSLTERFSWVWVMAGVLVLWAALVHAEAAAAIGIGFAAALSLSGSI